MNAVQMTWHLVRFELLRLRWLWAAFAALLVLSVLEAYNVISIAQDTIQMPVAPLLLQLLIIVLAVDIGQHESPYRRTAFLSAKPVPRPVLAYAKLVMVGVAFLMATIALGLSVVGLDLSFAEMADKSMVPLLFWLFTAVLAVLAGVSTRSMPSALLLIVAVLPTLLLLGQLSGTLFSFDPSTGRWLPMWGLAGVCLVSGVLVLLIHIGTPATPMIRGLVVVLGTMGLLATCASRTQTESPIASSGLPILSESVRFDSLPNVSFGTPALGFAIEGARADRKYELRNTFVGLKGSTDSTNRRGRIAMGARPRATVLDAAPANFAAPVSATWWVRPVGVPPQYTKGVLYEGLGTRDMPIIVDSVSVRTLLVRHRAVRVAERAFRVGEVVTIDGEQLELVSRRNVPTIIWRTLKENNARPDWDVIASGKPLLQRYFEVVVIDSLNRRAYSFNSSSGGSSSGSMTLLLMSRTVHEHQLDPVPELAQLMRRGTGASIAVYRWEEDGMREIMHDWRVENWPTTEPDRSRTVVELRAR